MKTFVNEPKFTETCMWIIYANHQHIKVCLDWQCNSSALEAAVEYISIRQIKCKYVHVSIGLDSQTIAKCFVELCTYVIPGVSNNVQTQRNPYFIQGSSAFHLVTCCYNLWESQRVRRWWFVNSDQPQHHQRLQFFVLQCIHTTPNNAGQLLKLLQSG